MILSLLCVIIFLHVYPNFILVPIELKLLWTVVASLITTDIILGLYPETQYEEIGLFVTLMILNAWNTAIFLYISVLLISTFF